MNTAMKHASPILLTAILLTCANCSSVTDISTSATVVQSQIIGKCFRLTQDVKIENVPHLKRLMLVKPADCTYAAAPTIPRGTTLTILRVERCIVPPGFVMDFTVARINQGEFQGSTVTTNSIGLTYIAHRFSTVELCPTSKNSTPPP